MMTCTILNDGMIRSRTRMKTETTSAGGFTSLQGHVFSHLPTEGIAVEVFNDNIFHQAIFSPEQIHTTTPATIDTIIVSFVSMVLIAPKAICMADDEYPDKSASCPPTDISKPAHFTSTIASACPKKFRFSNMNNSEKQNLPINFFGIIVLSDSFIQWKMV